MNDLKWCLNDDPHSEHWAYNEFNGRNYCSGRPEGRSVNEYTPTTHDVREAYQATDEGLDFRRVYQERGQEFDRWLTEHDRQVAERAWDEALTHVERLSDPASTINITPDRELITLADVTQAREENPYTKENNA